MSKDIVNLWFARNELNEIVSVVNTDNTTSYNCPICESKVIPKALNSKSVTPHFAHVDKEKCSNESMLHFWFKNKFIEKGDSFSIKTDKQYNYVCDNVRTEVTFKLESGTYRPDVIVETLCGQEIVFEMADTNKKSIQDYIDKWIELDKIVVEIDIKSLVNENKIFDALYFKGKCFNFKTKDRIYHNSIGKLKEDMKRSSKYDIELAKKLDWFWNEVKTNIDDKNKIVGMVLEYFDEEFILNKLLPIIKVLKCVNVDKMIVSEILHKHLKSNVHYKHIDLEIKSIINSTIKLKLCHKDDSYLSMRIEHSTWHDFNKFIKKMHWCLKELNNKYKIEQQIHRKIIQNNSNGYFTINISPNQEEMLALEILEIRDIFPKHIQSKATYYEKIDEHMYRAKLIG